MLSKTPKSIHTDYSFIELQTNALIERQGEEKEKVALYSRKFA